MTAWDPVAMRALSLRSSEVEWPPRLDARIHYNTGWPQTSWAGDVRAVVDNAVAVVLRASASGPERYALLSRWDFEGPAPYRYGPLPRALAQGPLRTGALGTVAEAVLRMHDARETNEGTEHRGVTKPLDISAWNLGQLLQRHRLRADDERTMQEAISRVFTAEGWSFEAEVSITGQSRIDFLVGGWLGVEVKIGRSWAPNNVLSQLIRYAGVERVESLVLVTTSMTLSARMPSTVRGKPLYAVYLAPRLG